MPLVLATTPAAAQTVAAPAGWSDAHDGDTRILTKNGITVKIGPWEDANGKSVRAWLKSQEQRGAPEIAYVSTQTLQAEKAVKGSYSLLRNVRVQGREQTSVLYACPGNDGSVKLMELRGAVSRQNASDIAQAAKFGENVCAADPKVAKVPPRTASTRSTGQPAQSLAAANAQIPAGSRPQSARIILEDKWVGFPAVRVSEAVPVMRFANGYATSCTKWDPLTQSPTPTSAGRVRGCEIARGIGRGKLAQKFRPGQTIDIDFGRTSGASTDWGIGSSSRISGGTLRMTKDGRIRIGKFNAFSVGSAGSGAGGGNRSMRLSGRYYLDGHTITIQADDGPIYHGFIAASSDSGSSRIDHVYINGEHYWDRKK